MPDFITVMKEWRRMCKASVEAGMKDGQGCMHHCILPDDFCGDLCCAKESDIIEAEHAIMKWAKEHPQPVYPTWLEWMREQGLCKGEIAFNKHLPIEHQLVMAGAFETHHILFDGERVSVVTEKAMESIPENTALALGLSPKEAES